MKRPTFTLTAWLAVLAASIIGVRAQVLVAWGDNSDGQTNVPDAALHGTIAIAAGDAFSVALTKQDSVLVWGRGMTNVPVAALSDVTAIGAGM